MKDFLNRMNQVEPARVRAVWVALVALLASAGYAVGSDVDAAVGAAIVLVFTVLPIIQGEATARWCTPRQPSRRSKVRSRWTR